MKRTHLPTNPRTRGAIALASILFASVVGGVAAADGPVPLACANFQTAYTPGSPGESNGCTACTSDTKATNGKCFSMGGMFYNRCVPTTVNLTYVKREKIMVGGACVGCSSSSEAYTVTSYSTGSACTPTADPNDPTGPTGPG